MGQNCTDFSSEEVLEVIYCIISKVLGADEFKYAVRNFQGAKGVAMATKFGQRKQILY